MRRLSAAPAGVPTLAAGTALALVLLGLCTVVLPGRALAVKPKPKSNNCADPFWEHTLRCLFTAPGEAPQPNLDDAPTDPLAIRAFTRVFLDRGNSVRSVDGTLPVIYVDKAVCTTHPDCDGIPFGKPIESDNWIISMTGGGVCSIGDSTGADMFDDPTECFENYEDPLERDEMGTAEKGAMVFLGGINNPSASLNPVFAGYNRIRIEKSTYDRYNGRVAYEASGGYFQVPGGTSRFDMWQQGFLLMEEVLSELQNGLNYTTWVATGDSVTEMSESLPHLSRAERVLFVGHSGGAHGLYHNIDHLAAILRDMPSFEGDVRALFDANFLSSVVNEAHFATGDPTIDVYSDVWDGFTATTNNGGGFSYDGEAYYASGPEVEESTVVDQLDAWLAEFDASCMEVHAIDGDAWKCRDRQHVLFNHISTPFLFREDFEDPNAEHMNSGAGHNVVWGPFDLYAHCPVLPGPVVFACPPILTLDEHRARLERQAETLLGESPTRSELATGADGSLGNGVFPTVYAWMPSCDSHEGAYQDYSFFSTSIEFQGTTTSMRDWTEEFMAAPRLSKTARLIDGWVDPVTLDEMSSGCPVRTP